MTTPAKSPAEKYYGCGDCDPCIGGRPDQCAVGGMVLAVDPTELMKPPAEKCAERIVNAGYRPDDCGCNSCANESSKHIAAIIQSEYAETFQDILDVLDPIVEAGRDAFMSEEHYLAAVRVCKQLRPTTTGD